MEEFRIVEEIRVVLPKGIGQVYIKDLGILLINIEEESEE